MLNHSWHLVSENLQPSEHFCFTVWRNNLFDFILKLNLNWFWIKVRISNFIMMTWHHQAWDYCSMILGVLHAILRSRVKISCKWRRVVMPQDRRSRCLPFIPVVTVCFNCFVAFIMSSLALHHVIMPACHLIFKTSTKQNCIDLLIYLNRGNSHGDFSL